MIRIEIFKKHKDALFNIDVINREKQQNLSKGNKIL